MLHLCTMSLVILPVAEITGMLVYATFPDHLEADL